MDKYITIGVTAAVFIVVSLVLHFYIPSRQLGLRVNQTDSLPYRVFTHAKADPNAFKYGDIVSFSHPYSKIPLAKLLMGLPGDTVKVDRNYVFVNDENLGEIKQEAPSGMRLTPITSGPIPAGYVFVYGEHVESFDSRYAEFGLIKIDDIQEVLCPIY